MKKIAALLLAPISNNKVFFINIIILLVLPAMINAYWINHEQYVTISSIYKWGIKIRDGANPPYIFFIPFSVSYIISTLSLLFGKRGQCVFKYLVYILLIGLLSINIFCLFNFSTMISPSIIMLMEETNSGETFEFFKTYLLNKDSIIAYAIIVLVIVYIFVSEHKLEHIIKSKIAKILITIISIYMFQKRFMISVTIMDVPKKQKRLQTFSNINMKYHL